MKMETISSNSRLKGNNVSAISVELDSESGFCPGVIRAVDSAERNLKLCGELYSLGAIVHNSSELERLASSGLKIIGLDEMENMHDATVLIRAHGEPPQTYDLARKNNIRLIDCTCPVVLKLQEKIRNVYKEEGAQVLIFGKEGHAEVNGLVGQVGNDAIILDVLRGGNGQENVIRNIERIDWTRDLVIFSQTTKDPEDYAYLCEEIRKRSRKKLTVYDTICRQVAHRHEHLINFAAKHNVILFVSGAESSNGKVLYDLCKSVNPHSYHIQSIDQIQAQWFNSLSDSGEGSVSIGVCGATSTPKWQLEEVVAYLKESKLLIPLRDLRK